MRLDSLNIPAFGPFSDFSLELPKSDHDIHLIHGRNEAGKSSLLRAINGLFFGIPSRTPDNFLHANTKLLVGATVSHGSDQLTFFRKKGLKNTLLDASQSTLEESVLKPFLEAVNEEFFQQMFGLNTESLREGAGRLLSGEGDLGTILFSASLGGSPIDDAIKKLEEEAGMLCRGASKKETTILPALNAFKEAERAARNETTTATVWKKLNADVAQAQAALDEQSQRYREHRQREQFVEACLRAIPVLSAIRRLEGEVAAIEVPDFPGDFPKQAREIKARLEVSRREYQLKKTQIETRKEALQKVGDYEKVLAASADFEMLHRRAAQHLENLELLPGLKVKLTERDLEKLPLVKAADQARLKGLAEILTKLDEQSSQLKRDLSGLRVELESQRDGLSDPRDLSLLEEQVRRLDLFSSEYRGLETQEDELETLRSEQERLTKRLKVEGDPRSLEVPGAKTIQAAQREQEQFSERVRDLQRQISEVRADLKDEEVQLKLLAGESGIFTPEDLAKSREERDGIWEGILKSREVDESLGRAIASADKVADALRDRADQLATVAGHQLKIARLQSRLELLLAELEEASSELEKWSNSWPGSSFGKLPVELLEWREDWEKLCGFVTERDSLESRIARTRQQEAAILEEFGGRDFTTVYRSLKSSLAKAHEEQGERKTLSRLLAKNELREVRVLREIEEVSEQLGDQKEKWSALCEETGTPVDLPPRAAVESLLERARARELLLDFQARASAVKDYQDLLEKTATTFEVEPSESSLAALYDRAKLDQNRARTLTGELEDLEREFPGVKLAWEADQKKFDILVEKAGSDDLEEVIAKVEQRMTLQAQLASQQEALQGLAGAKEPVEFISELEAQDRDQLAVEKESLSQSEEALQMARDEARVDLEEQLRVQKELLKASDEAAAQKQGAADALATVVSDTVRFRQLQYAIDFLKQQVEDYRQKTQGPMIGKTSDYFRDLTGGAFERVAAQLDAKGQPQLVAIRAGGEMVETGGLSEGTGDQLYLALRLAAIDLHLANHAPIPLILDDLLMTFDDERTKALLPVLAGLSQRTQVLIFTHHSHLKGLVGPKVTIHDLSV